MRRRAKGSVPHAKVFEIRGLASFLPQGPRKCRAFFRSASTACKDLRQAFYLALPLLSARCHLPIHGVVASSTAQPQRAGFRTVHASDLKILRNCRKPAHDRFACTRKRQSRQWLAAFVADAFILPFVLRTALRRLPFRLSFPTAHSVVISCGAVSGVLLLLELIIVGSPFGAWRSIVRLGSRVAAYRVTSGAQLSSDEETAYILVK